MILKIFNLSHYLKYYYREPSWVLNIAYFFAFLIYIFSKVIILDGNQIGAHGRSNLCNSICLKHLNRLRVKPPKKTFFPSSGRVDLYKAFDENEMHSQIVFFPE